MSHAIELISLPKLAAALEAKRAVTGLSWAAVAGQAGCASQTLSRVTRHERTRSGISLDSYVLLCRWLGVSLDTFVVEWMVRGDV